MTELWHPDIWMLSLKYLDDGNLACRFLNAVIQISKWQTSGIQIFECCHLKLIDGTLALRYLNAIIFYSVLSSLYALRSTISALLSTLYALLSTFKFLVSSHPTAMPTF